MFQRLMFPPSIVTGSCADPAPALRSDAVIPQFQFRFAERNFPNPQPHPQQNMKSTPWTSARRSTKQSITWPSFWKAVIAMLLLPSAGAADITQSASNAYGTSGFNSAVNWSNGLAPSAGNNYFNGSWNLRAPATGGDFTFAGDSLTIGDGTSATAQFAYKADVSGILTISDFFLRKATILSVPNTGDGSFALAGNIALAPDTTNTINQYAPATTITVKSSIAGVGALSIDNSGTAATIGSTTLTGVNSYSGNTIVKNKAVLIAEKDNTLGAGDVTVQAGGKLKLQSGATNDYISNSGRLLLASGLAAGSITLNYTGVDTNTGVDTIAGLSFDGGTTFPSSGTWGAAGSGAAHTSSIFAGTGILSVVPVPPLAPTVDARRDWMLSPTMNWSTNEAGENQVAGSAKYGMPYAVARLHQTNGDDTAARNFTVTASLEGNDTGADTTYFNPVGVVRAVYTWPDSFTGTYATNIANAMRAKKWWLAGGTENHELMRWSNAYLLAQKYPTGTWTRLGGGATDPPVLATQLMAEAKAKLLAAIEHYFTQGSEEYLSPNYTQAHLWPMANLYDFAQDAELKDAAKDYMNYVLAMISVNVLDGYIIEPYARSVGYSNTGVDAMSSTGGDIQENVSVLVNWLYWGQIQPTAARITKRYHGGADLIYLALSNYRPLDRLVRLANGQAGLPYVHKSKHAHGLSIRTADGGADIKQNAILRYVWRTRDYIMGSGIYNKFDPDDFYIQDSQFGISWKSADALHYLQCMHPYWYSNATNIVQVPDAVETPVDLAPPPYWLKGPSSPFMQVMQHKGTAIVLFNYPATDPWLDRGDPVWYQYRSNGLLDHTVIAFPKTMDSGLPPAVIFNDSFVNNNPNRWYFLYEGDTYIAIRTLSGVGNYTGSEQTQYLIHSKGRLNGSRYQSGFIFEVGTKDRWSSFANFKTQVLANASYSIVWGAGANPAQTVKYNTTADGDALEMTYNTSLTELSSGAGTYVNLVPTMKVKGVQQKVANWPLLQAPFLWMEGGVFHYQE